MSFTSHEDGEPSASYFSRVEEKDSGVYTCTRSYMYSGHIYNMTFTVPLTVKPSKEKTHLNAFIFQVFIFIKVRKIAFLDIQIPWSL